MGLMGRGGGVVWDVWDVWDVEDVEDVCVGDDGTTGLLRGGVR